MKSHNEIDKPEILGAHDLSHLNRGQRISLIVIEHWQSRRDLLKKLLGLAAVITLQPLFSISCSSGGSGSGCTSDGGTGIIVVDAPTVIGTYPADGDKESVLSFIKIWFSKPMNQTSVNEAMSVDPPIASLDFTAPGHWWSTDSKTAEYDVNVPIPEGTSYTFSVDGSAKSADDFFLYQTDAGGGGTTYFFNVFYDDGPGCGCDTYDACACQFDGGIGCPDYGGICWCEVECGCQLYGI